jgi:hypothetical protein
MFLRDKSHSVPNFTPFCAVPITIELPERASHTKFKLEHRLVSREPFTCRTGKAGLGESGLEFDARGSIFGREIPATAVAKFPARSSKAKQRQRIMSVDGRLVTVTAPESYHRS